MSQKMKSQDEISARSGSLTADKIVQAAFLRGQGYTHDQISRELDIRNTNALVTVLKAHGIPDVGQAGMREIRVLLSNARYADVAAMTRQAGYQLETGVGEFLAISAKDRTIRSVLEKTRR